jgi:hypothetical protein
LVFWNQPGRSVVVDALQPDTDRSERVGHSTGERVSS